jgi:hypothetical protein
MILNVKNETQFEIQFCSGQREYELKPGETATVEVEDQDIMYLNQFAKGDGAK